MPVLCSSANRSAETSRIVGVGTQGVICNLRVLYPAARRIAFSVYLTASATEPTVQVVVPFTPDICDAPVERASLARSQGYVLRCLLES